MEGSKEQDLPHKPDTGASGNVSVHEVASPQSDIDSKEGSEKGKGTFVAKDMNEISDKLTLQSNNGVDSTDISPQGIDNAEILSKSEGHPTEEKTFIESLDGSASSTIEKIDLKSCRQNVNEDPSHSDQQDSATQKENSLKGTVDCQTSQKRTDGANVVQLVAQNDTKLVEPSSGDEPTEDTLVNKVKDPVSEETERTLGNEMTELELAPEMEVITTDEVEGDGLEPELNAQQEVHIKTPSKTFLLDTNAVAGDEMGTEEEQAAFMQDLESFHKERSLEFKPPRFYGEPLNCLKLWRAVIKLGGYEQVTSCKLWRQVGESFNPPKTCTTVSWTFRGFYEKALLEYEKHKMRSGELPFSDASCSEPSSTGNQIGLGQAPGSGRARRDAAARAMQGWHSQRLLGNGEVGDPIIKDKSSVSLPKREKQLKSVGLLKRKRLSPADQTLQGSRIKASKPQVETMVVDVGAPADWVKINVQKTKDCFEVYALVPGLLREEVRVQSDPAGRLVISGQPEQLDNPWGVTPFKKVVSLPSRIDPHQTSAVVTLHGQLFVRVPFEQADA